MYSNGPPRSQWPVFSGENSELEFYTGLVVSYLKETPGVPVDRDWLLSVLPRKSPNLCVYYESGRRSRSGRIKWVDPKQARILWKSVCRHPGVWGRKKRASFRGIAGTITSPERLHLALQQLSGGGVCGVDEKDLEGSCVQYICRESRTVAYSLSGLSRTTGVKETVLAARILDSSDNSIEWEPCLDLFVSSLSQQGLVGVFGNKGARVFMPLQHRSLPDGGASVC